MAGHSKWANIKHRKARQDAKRGQSWTKCSRAIIVAARNGGGDPSFNSALRLAVDEAKAANMPKDTIEKAIKRGTGELDGVSYEPVRYEAYGPSGVAIIIDCLTDKVTRTAPEMRTLLEKNGGNLAKPGAVAFGFESKGVVLLTRDQVEEEPLMEVVLDAGAEDVQGDDDGWQVTCPATDLAAVRDALVEASLEPVSAEVSMIPTTTVDCDEATAEKLGRLLDALEDHDDVQKVWTNMA